MDNPEEKVVNKAYLQKRLAELESRVCDLEAIAHKERYPEDPRSVWVNKYEVLELIDHMKG